MKPAEWPTKLSARFWLCTIRSHNEAHSGTALCVPKANRSQPLVSTGCRKSRRLRESARTLSKTECLTANVYEARPIRRISLAPCFTGA